MIAPKEPESSAAGSLSAPLRQDYPQIGIHEDPSQQPQLNNSPALLDRLDAASVRHLRGFFELLDRLDRKRSHVTDAYDTEKRIGPWHSSDPAIGPPELAVAHHKEAAA